MSVVEKLQQALDKRKVEGNYRELSVSKAASDFFSNDYLGLSKNKVLQEKINTVYNSLSSLGNGSTGSRLLSGNHAYYEQLEERLSKIFHGTSLVFNSGYNANLAIFSTIPQKGDTIIYDELIHACIKEGARLSFANRYTFKHNNLIDLESKLKKATGEKFVAIESVYSMDGDFAPLEEIIPLVKKYKGQLIIDEAHTTGAFGTQGSGLVCEKELEDSFLIRVYTFGKAIGAHGACVISNPTVINYLINYARPFIYTTALPLHNLVTINCAFNYIRQNPQIAEELHKKINYFRNAINEAKEIQPQLHFIESYSAIQAIVVPGNSNVVKLSEQLIEKGFDVRPIRYPTVAQGKERLRICLHAYNTYSEIDELVEVIKSYKY